jgi:hypothetical protein
VVLAAVVLATLSGITLAEKNRRNSKEKSEGRLLDAFE